MEDEIEKGVKCWNIETPITGYTGTAWYIKNSNDAVVEIYYDNATVKIFKVPAYKAYNILAHFSEIVHNVIYDSTDGLNSALSFF